MAETTQAPTPEGEPPELKRARAMGRLLDDAIRVPGTEFRIGLDPILGIVPFLGDGAASIGSLYIVFVGFRLGVPAGALARMFAYVAIDYFVGSVPVLGTLIDAVVKVNKRNVSIIERHVANETSLE